MANAGELTISFRPTEAQAASERERRERRYLAVRAFQNFDYKPVSDWLLHRVNDTVDPPISIYVRKNAAGLIVDHYLFRAEVLEPELPAADMTAAADDILGETA